MMKSSCGIMSFSGISNVCDYPLDYGVPPVVVPILYFARVHRVLESLAPFSATIGSGMIYVDDLGWITTRKEFLRMPISILSIYKALGLAIAYDKL